MIENQLPTNQLGLAATARYLDTLDATEMKEIGQAVDLLAENVNNAPSGEGKNAVVEQLRTQWQHYRGVTHEVLGNFGSDTGFVSEALHHYERHDGTQITARTAVFTDRSDDGLEASIRVNSDARRFWLTSQALKWRRLDDSTPKYRTAQGSLSDVLVSHIALKLFGSNGAFRSTNIDR